MPEKSEPSDKGGGVQRDSPLRGVVNPRLSDGHGLVIIQDEVDFVVPHLREDLPLYLDPFLLWASADPLYQGLHDALLGFVDLVRRHALDGRDYGALRLLDGVAEPVELGLGYAQGTKRGSAIGPGLAAAIVETFRQTPQLADESLSHVEVLALLVPRIAEDRISDLVASTAKHWLAQFTAERCAALGIPTRRYRLDSGWDADRREWCPVDARLPWNPIDESPVLLAPLNLLRHLPWINYSDYYRSTYSRLVLPPDRRGRTVAKEAVLAYNRRNYEVVREYVKDKEDAGGECGPDPLFKPLSLKTLRRRIAELAKLPTGRDRGADKRFEQIAFDLLASLLYPELDLAASQVRTLSGAHIRDVIFHNDEKTSFLRDLRELYAARQIVFELKNVAALDTDHVNQLYRYLDGENIGRFGVLVGRRPPQRNVVRNTVDLHSAKRAAVLCLDDTDLDLMVQLAEAGRRPVEVLRKKHIEFVRMLPS